MFFKLVVLSAVLAVALSAPAPGYLGGYGGYALPAATSYTSRVDVHSKPIITTYAAPLVAAPVSYHVPTLSHTTLGLHEAPLVAGYGYGLGHHGYESLGHELYGYGHGW